MQVMTAKNPRTALVVYPVSRVSGTVREESLASSAIWTEQSKPTKAVTGTRAPTRVATPMLDHPPGLKNSRIGKLPSILGDKTHRGIKITMPRI